MGVKGLILFHAASACGQLGLLGRSDAGASCHRDCHRTKSVHVFHVRRPCVGHRHQLSAYHWVVERDVRYIHVGVNPAWGWIGRDQTTLNPVAEVASKPHFRMGELLGPQLSLKYYYIL